jgi:DUF971 family protein
VALPTSSTATGSPASADGNAPADVSVSLKNQRMEILWRDGFRGQYELGPLRKLCPCATCRQNRREHKPGTSLPILSIPNSAGRLEVVDVALMGHYAINLKWSDGHDTGIYEYRALRELAESNSSST